MNNYLKKLKVIMNFISTRDGDKTAQSRHYDKPCAVIYLYSLIRFISLGMAVSKSTPYQW